MLYSLKIATRGTLQERISFFSFSSWVILAAASSSGTVAPSGSSSTSGKNGMAHRELCVWVKSRLGICGEGSIFAPIQILCMYSRYLNIVMGEFSIFIGLWFVSNRLNTIEQDFSSFLLNKNCISCTGTRLL